MNVRYTTTMNKKSNKLVILAGPSCVGKSPLANQLKRFYPALYKELRPVVLYNSRPPRPGETEGADYHFRSREEVLALKDSSRYVVMDVRGDLQALDLEELGRTLTEGNAFFEGNPFVGRELVRHAQSIQVPEDSLFISPLSRRELDFLKAEGADIESVVTEVMRQKLVKRTRRQRGVLSEADLEEIERRAGSAYAELKMAHCFDYVVPNHDGEDSLNWEHYPVPLGDAGNLLFCVAAFLQGHQSSLVEEWSENTI